MSIVIDELSSEHADVLARIARTADRFADAKVCADFVDFIEREIVPHFALEEDALFPELARIPPIASGPLRVMNAEHDTFRDLLQAARRARQDGNEPQLSRTATDLAALLQSHIAKEDGVLFPLALEMLSEEQLARVDSRGGPRRVAESKCECGRA